MMTELPSLDSAVLPPDIRALPAALVGCGHVSGLLMRPM
jgi:hypothetical protein